MERYVYCSNDERASRPKSIPLASVMAPDKESTFVSWEANLRE
jgi:hypothetical protein